MATQGDIEVIQGNDYAQADGNRIEFTDTTGEWPGIAGAGVSFIAKSLTTDSPAFVKSGLVVSTAPKTVGIELTALETQGLDATLHEFWVDAIPAGPRRVTLVAGRMRVRKKPA